MAPALSTRTSSRGSVARIGRPRPATEAREPCRRRRSGSGPRRAQHERVARPPAAPVAPDEHDACARAPRASGTRRPSPDVGPVTVRSGRRARPAGRRPVEQAAAEAEPSRVKLPSDRHLEQVVDESVQPILWAAPANAEGAGTVGTHIALALHNQRICRCPSSGNASKPRCRSRRRSHSSPTSPMPSAGTPASPRRSGSTRAPSAPVPAIASGSGCADGSRPWTTRSPPTSAPRRVVLTGTGSGVSRRGRHPVRALGERDAHRLHGRHPAHRPAPAAHAVRRAARSARDRDATRPRRHASARPSVPRQRGPDERWTSR